MAEGAMPGAPEISGVDSAEHFYHQPPPVAGLSMGGSTQISSEETQVDTPDSEHHERRPLYQASRAPSPSRDNMESSTPGPRAHFPEDGVQLAQAYSARPIPTESHSSRYAGEKDREPASHRGVWQSFRDWCESWQEDFGAPHKHQDVADIIGDAGIDPQIFRKMKSHGRVSSLVAPSMMLARPGLGQHTDTSTAIPTPTQPWMSMSRDSSPGSSTPATPSRKSHAGVDPHEVTRALRKLKEKFGNGNDSKRAKYIQAKAELAHRRNVVLLLVYAFMAYGAPSHRIEEYTLALLKALDMEGRVNYTVGCTEISFINPVDPADPMTRSAYTTLVKAQGLDIGACETAFRIYKDVVHGAITVEEATQSLVTLIESPSYYRPWHIVPFYGFASAFAAIWAYNGWWSDMAISFFLGCIVGFLQVIVASRNPLYNNVLEVTSSLITAFAARAFSSIGGPSQKYFCFGAISESSITTILPGYIVLCGTLELQSKSITAGSTRLFYAVMYSLLLGYGINVGAQLWAVIDPDAVTSSTCPRSVDPRWKILLVPSYLVLQAVLIRSRPRQIPIQVILGSAAYTVNYFVSQYATAQVANTASAFVLGVLGHLWARSQHAFAFAAVVAGIMVLVPSGLSAQGGLLLGISTPLFNNGSTDAQGIYEQTIYHSFSVGAQMIQVAVGLAVGLFISALVVYPFGRKNNALFSF
ncbi:hypothetical protein JX265_005629 [Neoarthrinium moseri]|uniref:Pheromone-regulated membrane protein n=1 Tax=Neoarthrinium moseri TaxID=1658444 RepID=A0A9P9WNE0_9PEZI|nr:hypothetical protein JX265_005629 [Neoarthrinium moseri]